MTTSVCRRCGRTFTTGDADRGEDVDSLADTPGAEQPPESAGMLTGATPFDAELGTDSGPVEYVDDDVEYDEDELCRSCRSELRRVR